MASSLSMKVKPEEMSKTSTKKGIWTVDSARRICVCARSKSRWDAARPMVVSRAGDRCLVAFEAMLKAMRVVT